MIDLQMSQKKYKFYSDADISFYVKLINLKCMCVPNIEGQTIRNKTDKNTKANRRIHNCSWSVYL